MKDASNNISPRNQISGSKTSMKSASIRVANSPDFNDSYIQKEKSKSVFSQNTFKTEDDDTKPKLHRMLTGERRSAILVNENISFQ